MAFIDDNAHVWLLVMIVFVAGAVVGLSVVYQQNFKAINDRYEFKLQELNNTFNSLVNTKSELNSTIQELQVKSEREEDLTGKYSVLKIQNKELETIKAELEATVNTKNLEIASKNEEIRTLQNNLEELEDKKDELCAFIASSGLQNGNC